MEQHDGFGVIPEGALMQDDISDLAVQLVAKNAYIARLRRRIAELTPAPAQPPEPMENGAGAVSEAGEIVKGKAKA